MELRCLIIQLYEVGEITSNQICIIIKKKEEKSKQKEKSKSTGHQIPVHVRALNPSLFASFYFLSDVSHRAGVVVPRPSIEKHGESKKNNTRAIRDIRLEMLFLS